MTCKETIRLICEYLDGRLVPSVNQEIRAHLDECKNCGTVVDAARKTLKFDFDTAPRFPTRRKSQVA